METSKYNRINCSQIRKLIFQARTINKGRRRHESSISYYIFIEISKSDKNIKKNTEGNEDGGAEGGKDGREIRRQSCGEEVESLEG